MGGGAGCVCGVEAVDEAAEDETEEEGEPTAAAAADVCSTTAVATGAEAATSSEAEAGAAATATAGEGDDDDEEPAGSELWDDSLPGILGNEHTSQRVMSSWFWNVQRLQVHCSPAAAGWRGSCGSPTTGADIERPP